jgi:hypothetical protein
MRSREQRDIGKDHVLTHGLHHTQRPAGSIRLNEHRLRVRGGYQGNISLATLDARSDASCPISRADALSRRDLLSLADEDRSPEPNDQQ